MHAAAHSDRTAKPICNPTSYPEAQAGSVFSLGGKERLEDASSMVWRDSATAVSKRNTKLIDCRNLAPISGLANPQCKATIDGHSLHCIDQQLLPSTSALQLRLPFGTPLQVPHRLVMIMRKQNQPLLWNRPAQEPLPLLNASERVKVVPHHPSHI